MKRGIQPSNAPATKARRMHRRPKRPQLVGHTLRNGTFSIRGEVPWGVSFSGHQWTGGPPWGGRPGTGFATFGATDVFDDEISQVLPTVAGQVYTVSFELGINQPQVSQDFSVMF